MLRIPRELEEAAFADGASRLYTFRRVVLPLAMPGILIAGINCFLTVYAQQFIYALTFNSKSEYMPLSVGLFAFFGRQEVTWNELMAASIVGITPGDDRLLLPAEIPRRGPHRRRREIVRIPFGV